MQRDCPNARKVLFSAATNDYESVPESDSSEHEHDEFFEAICGPEEALDMLRLSIVAQRSLSVTVSQNDQREQLFYTRAVMRDVTLSVIIDSGSCANFISRKAVEHFGLPTKPHPAPFKL